MDFRIPGEHTKPAQSNFAVDEYSGSLWMKGTPDGWVLIVGKESAFAGKEGKVFHFSLLGRLLPIGTVIEITT